MEGFSERIGSAAAPKMFHDVFVPPECGTRADGLAAVIASCSPLAFPGMDDIPTGLKRPFFPMFDAASAEETGDEDLCDDSTAPHVEKKRRLSVEQVKSLEKNFEIENKLEPDRKIQLAKELGLQPRQVAVWFQNRRARWKTKQLEKDYDLLKSEYDSLKASFADLAKDRDRLQSEVSRLRLCMDDPLGHKQPELGTMDELDNCPAATKTIKQEEEESTKVEEPAIVSCLQLDDTTGWTTTTAKFACKKEGSFCSDSDASEILEVESPVEDRVTVVAVAAASSIDDRPVTTIAFECNDANQVFLYDDGDHHHHFSKFLPCQDEENLASSFHQRGHHHYHPAQEQQRQHDHDHDHHHQQIKVEDGCCCADEQNLMGDQSAARGSSFSWAWEWA